MNNSNNDNNKQNYNNNIQSQPLNQNQMKKKENNEAAQDVAHTVGKGAATYFGGALGNKLYDAASKTKLGQGIEKAAGKMAMNNPALRPGINNLHKSGATKIANSAIDTLGGQKGSINGLNKGVKSTNKDLGISSQNKMTIPTRNTQKVTPSVNNEEPDFSNMTEEQIEEYQNQQEELKRQQINQENQEKRKAKVKKIGEAIIRNPHLAMLVVGIGVIVIFVVIIMYMIVSDMDLVGTKMTSYSQAESISGYCDHITLVKEHDSFTGEPVASIDDVNLDETFKLNNTTVKRYSIKTYDVESYVKGVVQAEAEAVNDAKTFEVAAIAARTYALQITNRQCLTWDNTNKRPQYRNPQNFTDSSPSELVASGVTGTQGLVITIDGQLLDLSQNNYYDYFCNIGKTREEEDHVFYQMLQKNEEERLLIPIKWAKDNNAENLNYSGKYDGNCQENGMSLFGAKYLLNKKADAYTTIRIIKYYYGYHVELKKLDTLGGGGCYWWPLENGAGTITSKYGPRNISVPGSSKYHMGVDIAIPLYTPIIASNSGEVVEVYTACPKTTAQKDCGSGWGNHVRIKHSDGKFTNYAHMSDVNVTVGQSVSQGEVIGKSGNSGASGGAHVHFEIWENSSSNSRIDPLNIISQTNPKPSCSSSINSGGAIVDTGINTKSFCLSLKNKGFSNEAIAGIMANLESESGFDPNAFNASGGGQGAYGICQWRGNRQSNLKMLANYNTLPVQIEYMLSELNTSYKTTLTLMMTPGTADDMTYNWCATFEVPGKTTALAQANCRTRVSNKQTSTANYLTYARNNCS